MEDPSFILASEQEKTFTYLNRYIPKKKNFEGEYSLIHNAFSEDSFFLSQFLFRNVDKPLVLLPSHHKDYRLILNTYHRFLEKDIPNYIEEKIQKDQEQKNTQYKEQQIGQFQLLLLKKMIEKELEKIEHLEMSQPENQKILLGKKLGIEWVLFTISDIIEKGRI